MICDYGCGQEACYILNNGKHCCVSDYHQCPGLKKKISDDHLSSNSYKPCPVCGKLVFCKGGQYNAHVKKCTSLFEKKQLLETKDVTKYIKWYNQIIEKRQKQPLIEGYRECHHITPKSLGGTNDKSNLIYLTPREHYICHMLLVEIYAHDPDARLKMLSAFMMMKTRVPSGVKMNSKIYESYRKELSKCKKNTGCGIQNNNYGHIWIYNAQLDQNKSIKKEEFSKYEQLGWEKGRCDNKTNYLAKKQGIKFTKKFYTLKKAGVDVLTFDWEKEKREKEAENKKLYLEYYEIYKEFGWKGICEKTNYSKSRANLIQQFRKYLPDIFIPKNQNAKK